jgi:cytochrome c-type biogenesis protein CcmH
MSASRFVFLMTVCLLASAPVWATQVEEDPLERHTLDIAKDLRCTVCQNQSVAESNADIARDMRQIIREQLQAGKSRDEIVQYFVDRYGDFVLMKPPAVGAGAILWTLPAVLGVVLGVSAFFYLRRRRHEPVAPPPSLSAADLERVRKAREDLNL